MRLPFVFLLVFLAILFGASMALALWQYAEREGKLNTVCILDKDAAALIGN